MGAIAGGFAGSNPHCRAALLSATATSTGSVHSVRKAPGSPADSIRSWIKFLGQCWVQGTVASSLPKTATSLLRPYLCDFVAPAPLMWAHMFFLSLMTLRTCTIRYQGTSPPPTYTVILSNRLSRRPEEIFTPLPPRRIPKDGLPIV